ncbi:SDR family NAD(P)-dependent oxidoreductase [Serratia proteamaculans]|uniref:SDR family oxidoreductase n=1 Tax=Serratia proteamaculans TaxID=28151 RepID=A0A5Q2VC57_SERPR|nr:SDR family oxidoreductase [Serratia proteamaculans]QGH61595.1 SDR family oxidoreductase [Serratia proteamaculans]
MKMKTVIVTGASSGIGFAIAQAYLAQGFNVVANGRTQQELENAAVEFGSPENLLLVAGDISQPATAKALFSQAEARFGRVDVLVNNAGVFISKPIADYVESDLDTMLGVNMKGFFYTSQVAAEHMRAHGGGHIIAITAAIAMQPNVNVPALLPIMVKGGLNHAVRGLALELANSNIMVNAIAPGIISTPMHSQDKQTMEVLKTMAPTNQVGEVQDIVNAVMYLTDSKFVTGSIMVVDGGATSGKW